MNYTVFLKHIDIDTMGEKLTTKRLVHAYDTLDGMFALRAGRIWDVETTLKDDYVVLDIQGDGSKDEALKMVAKVIAEQNWAIRGLRLDFYQPNTH
ncbi:hypothetical protein GTP46_11255 [Duganella sp. FT135W]|uniref:Uncharacterized protein n=1 Tax=Duganella flavida TaxID=2692175 RepID=A0A6L8K6V8_9BURK|nr:hypothetical protein [Duganella flavida]MYM23223.1 hypothetical protein [Duganella flavida]